MTSNKIVERIFKHYKPNFIKLQEYGFTKVNDMYSYNVEIMDRQFSMNIQIKSSDIFTEIIDLATNEPYTLFLAEDACGSFIGAVKTAYEKILSDIAEKCFEKSVFKSAYAQQLIRYVTDTYGDKLEFMWEKFPDNAIWRRADNKKWYGLILTVAKNKIGIPSDEKVEIIDLRVNPKDIDTIVDNNTIFSGYHMNKKHWITICLDGTVPLKDIKAMLDASYEIARNA
ncbi:MAG: MmcQ/YjbR family DNA-binding protein [Clostridia bacterium]|nr:MmcQ/YjbR family DNA-binding protein [Clostridia bacterium]